MRLKYWLTLIIARNTQKHGKREMNTVGHGVWQEN